MLIALTRPVSSSINDCELTHLARVPIDVARAEAQHRAYVRVLEDLGCQVRQLPPAPDLPDAVFVEDLVVVLDEIAILTRPGAQARRAEMPAYPDVIRSYRLTRHIQDPGTVDGGDVLRAGQTLYVGHTARTNQEGIEQLEDLVSPFGYRVQAVTVNGCLHLKTAVTEVGDGLLLLNPRWVDRTIFFDFDLVECDPTEPFGANALRVGNKVVHAAQWERTRERLYARGIDVTPVEASELAKAEAGVTCCSVVFQARNSGPFKVDVRPPAT